MLTQYCNGNFFNGSIHAEYCGYAKGPVEQAGKQQDVAEHGDDYGDFDAPGVIADDPMKFDEADHNRQRETQRNGDEIRKFLQDDVRPQYPRTNRHG